MEDRKSKQKPQKPQKTFIGACPVHFVDYEKGCAICDAILKRNKPERKGVDIL